MKGRSRVRRVVRFAAIWPLVAAALAGTAHPAAAADVPPIPLQKPGWILDRHDEFNGLMYEMSWPSKLVNRSKRRRP